MYFDLNLTEVYSKELVEVMPWRRLGEKPLTEPILAEFINVYMRH